MAGRGRRSRPTPMSGCSTGPTAPPRRTSCRPSSTSRRLPRCCSRNSPPAAAWSSAPSGWTARPDAARLFASLYGRSANAVWLDSSLGPRDRRRTGSAAAERSRFSILADDGGTLRPVGPAQFGRHQRDAPAAPRSRTDGPFFRWLDGVWGRRAAPRAPRATRASSPWAGSATWAMSSSARPAAATSPPTSPDACLLFAGRAVVLDHAEGTVWLLALDAPDAGGLARRRPAPPSPRPRKRGGRRHRPAAAAPSNLPAHRPVPDFTAAGPEAAYKAQDRRGPARDHRGQHLRGLPDHRADGRTARPRPLDPWQAYLALRRRNPAPFASYLRFGEPRPWPAPRRSGSCGSRPTAGCAPSRSRAPGAGTRTRRGTRRCGRTWSPRRRTAPRTS